VSRRRLRPDIRQCVQASLGHANTDRNVDTRWTQMLAHSRT